MDIAVLLLILLILLFCIQLIMIVYFYNKFHSIKSPVKEEDKVLKIRRLRAVFSDDGLDNVESTRNNKDNNQSKNKDNNQSKNKDNHPKQQYLQNMPLYEQQYPYYPQSIQRNYPYYNPGYGYIWDPYVLNGLNGCSCGNRHCKDNSHISNNNNIYIKPPYNNSNLSQLKPTQAPQLYPTQAPQLYPTQAPQLYPTSQLYPTQAPQLYPTQESIQLQESLQESMKESIQELMQHQFNSEEDNL